ncbi:Regulator of chromosome condensation (RCC1) repeat [Phytophthora infestans]|uniref:Regulator of chromosome condensation (RCC1) repeat n=1 Tax=Phytophthora infestans TaxID=4787 RepID=A0A833TJS9_PHYIN|nr:Regulator of chromosome condensation (RCC1) repeat [Phytophthora infestans]
MQPSIHANVLDLWACARSPEAAPALARLLQDTVPPDDRNNFGETALHVAAAHGNDEAVLLLLRYEANMLAADWESGWTPLHRSLYHQHLSTSLLLLRHAQTRFGKKFLRKLLHETRDHSQQSPMQLLSTRLQHHRNSQGACDGGLIYTFGKRDYQLGYHLPNADVQITPRLVELPTNSPIVQLSASKYHTIALNAAGECFVWGFGKGGRLGTGSEFDCVEPTRLESLETTPMKKVVAGENHTMALSRTGQVFSWGSNSFGQLGHRGKSSSSQSRLTPKRIDAFRFHLVADIAASGCHSAAIDADDGAVYTWGSNRRGQLGRKEGCGTDQADATPQCVDALRPRHPMCVVYGAYDFVRAEKLALSDWHTCVVLRCAHNGRSLGQIWQFGYGSYRPSRVNLPSGRSASTSVAGAVMCDTWIPTCKQRAVDIVEVSCAQNHSIALSASGSVFTWGHNVPALSHQPSSSSQDRNASLFGDKVPPVPSPSAPQKVLLGTYGPVASVCASQDHCAVVTQQGDLVTWGCGQQGVLGHGRGNTWQPSPKRVAGVKKAVAVAAGHQHTAVLVAPVHPDFKDVAKIAAEDMVPTLVELVERKIAAHVDVINCALVWQFAERYAARRLQSYCVEYMRYNWDAVLDAVGRDRMDTLFEIMLPPIEVELEDKASAILPGEVTKKPTKEGKTTKHANKCTSKKGSIPPESATQKVSYAADEDLLATTSLEGAPVKSSAAPSKPKGRRTSRNSKFVPLTSFFTNMTAVAPKHGDASCPWTLSATSAFVEEKKSSVAQIKRVASASPASNPTPLAPHAFRLPKSSLRKVSLYGNDPGQRKASIGSHPSTSPLLSFTPLPVSGKHMLGYDGVEHEQVTAFSLDAFLKPARRGTRGKRSAWSNTSTSSTAEQKLQPKTLKEIQEEEEAAAAREREAKARLGVGFAPAQRPHSTVNSWGLFRPPDHISLADVQKMQEEHEFLEQQRQILADIERKQAAKARETAASPFGDVGRSKRSDATGGNRRGRKAVRAGGGTSGAVASVIDGDSQSKQIKQKKAKERKAARKAAGETFSSFSTQPARLAGRKTRLNSAKSSEEAPPTRSQSKPKAVATFIAA